MRSLVVDDELTNRMILSRVLGQYGACVTACGGTEAVAAFDKAHADKTPFDLICMDIMMPGMDGHEALAKIRDQEAALAIAPGTEAKVIMITALEDTRNVCRSFFDGGATAYITKPVDMETLRAALREAKLID